jgi:hypothetical protein
MYTSRRKLWNPAASSPTNDDRIATQRKYLNQTKAFPSVDREPILSSLVLVNPFAVFYPPR